MTDKKTKKKVKELNKKMKELEKAFQRMQICPCKGDKDLKQREVDLRTLREQIYALERERDYLIYTWWDKAPR